MSNRDILGMGDSCDATVIRNAGNEDQFGLEGVYTFTCYDAAGNLKWEDTIGNLTTNVGRKSLLDSYFANTGGGAIVMGLGGPNGSATFTPAYGDTQGSHTGWYEVGGALVYNSTTGAACFVLNFGSDKTATNSFTVQFPTANATNAILRIS